MGDFIFVLSVECLVSSAECKPKGTVLVHLDADCNRQPHNSYTLSKTISKSSGEVRNVAARNSPVVGLLLAT